MSKTITIIILLCHFAIFAQNSEKLIPYKIGNLFGYSNTDFEVKIKPQFEFAFPFHNNSNTALAKDSIGWFHINKKGIKISSFLIYENIKKSISTKIYEKGKLVSEFTERLNNPFRIKKSDLLYVKDTLGEYLITEDGVRVSDIYQEINGYSNENYCIAKKGLYYYLLDLNGKELFSKTKWDIKRYNKGVIEIRLHNKNIVYDSKNDTVFESFNSLKSYRKSNPLFIEQINERLRIRKTKNGVVLYDLKKEKNITKTFSYLSKISNKRLCFRKENTYGIINLNGKILLEIKQEKSVDIYNCGDDFRLIYIKNDKNNNYDLYNYDGKHIKTVDYDRFVLFHSTKEYRFAEKNNELIIINKKAKEFNSSPIILNSETTILYEKNQKWGIKNILGEKITEPVYDEKFSFNENISLVKRDGNPFYIDIYGNEYKL